MRIIAGKYGGRIIKSPKKASIHPMSEKMRGAIFNSLGDISELTLFDAYAGSGAIGLEALSRGAKFVLFTDKEKSATKTINENTKQLGIDSKQFKLSEANCVSYITNNQNVFDVIIADPPYNDIKTAQLSELVKYLSEGGLFILSTPPNFDFQHVQLQLIKSKNYGDAKLQFYKLSA